MKRLISNFASKSTVVENLFFFFFLYFISIVTFLKSHDVSPLNISLVVKNICLLGFVASKTLSTTLLIGLLHIERPILGDNPKAHNHDNEKRTLFVKSTCTWLDRAHCHLPLFLMCSRNRSVYKRPIHLHCETRLVMFKTQCRYTVRILRWILTFCCFFFFSFQTDSDFGQIVILKEYPWKCF